VAGLYTYIFAGSSPLGALIAGGLAASGGTDLAFLVAGATALACAIFGAIMLLRVRAHSDASEAASKTV
jgi:hypothetical protein